MQATKSSSGAIQPEVVYATKTPASTSQVIANLLDDFFTVPGTTFKVGLDGIVGLIPVIGEAITTVLSLFIVYSAALEGVPFRTLLRMLGNVLLDTIVGSVPVLGDVFDFAWRANRKNIALLEAVPPSDFRPRSSDQVRKLIQFAGLFFIAAIVALTGALTYFIFHLFERLLA